MNLKSQKGFTGIDIAIAIVVIFIFSSIIAILVYNFNASSKELERKREATYIAIDELEKIKKEEFDKVPVGNLKTNERVEGKDEYLETITVTDYKDIAEGKDVKQGIVKKIEVKISYMSRGKEKNVELSTIITKE